MPFIEGLKEIIEKNYHVPGNPVSDGDLDLAQIGWGGGVNDETEDVLVVDGEGGDEDDDAIDYIHSDEAVASTMAGDEQQQQHIKNSNFSLCHNYSNSLLYGSCDEKRTL